MDEQQKRVVAILEVPGLYYIPDAVPPELQNEIIEHLAQTNDWFKVGYKGDARKVIHYGYKYNYATKDTQESSLPMPQCMVKLIDIIKSIKILPDDFLNKQPRLQQCLINSYQPGQGIASHADAAGYDDYICCFTIGSGAFMDFTFGTAAGYKVYTEPNSLYIMSGDARYKWRHEMKANKTDLVNGKRIKRGNRISLTFRSLVTIPK